MVRKSSATPAQPGKKKKTAAASAEGKEILQKELRGLMKQLEEEDLAFLVQQATTMIYNRKVEELNRSRELSDRVVRKGADKKGQEPTEHRVFFEPGGKENIFYLDIDGKRAILDRTELTALVKTAQAAEDPGEARRRVHQWLKNHRDDILFDCELPAKGIKMDMLCERLRTDFAVR